MVSVVSVSKNLDLLSISIVSVSEKVVSKVSDFIMVERKIGLGVIKCLVAVKALPKLIN